MPCMERSEAEEKKGPDTDFAQKQRLIVIYFPSWQNCQVKSKKYYSDFQEKHNSRDFWRINYNPNFVSSDFNSTLNAIAQMRVV